MSDETRAAAGPGDDIYTAAAVDRLGRNWFDTYGCTAEGLPRVLLDDIEIVRHEAARAYLAAHPADDAEPVTEEWLRAVGFVYVPGQRPEHASGFVISMTEPDPTFGIFGEEMRLVDSVSYWSVEVRNRARGWSEGVGLENVADRGDVRRLCSALGIKLAEAPVAGNASR